MNRDCSFMSPRGSPEQGVFRRYVIATPDSMIWRIARMRGEEIRESMEAAWGREGG